MVTVCKPERPLGFRSSCCRFIEARLLEHDTDLGISALFVTYLIYSVLNLRPTAAEKTERQAEREADLEMKKLTAYGDDLSREERREVNRQLFLNLPKTPNTPGFGQNPMTPRTTAFTQLEGGHVSTMSGAGPSRALPFREYSATQTAPDGR